MPSEGLILTAVQQSQQELFICIGGTEKLHILWLYFTVVLKKSFLGEILFTAKHLGNLNNSHQIVNPVLLV